MVLLYNLAKYQSQFAIQKLIAQTKGVKFSETLCINCECLCLCAEMIRDFMQNVFWSDRDFLIIDTPPGTSDEHVSVVQNLHSYKPDGAVLITTPQVYCHNLAYWTVLRNVVHLIKDLV